MRVIGGKHRGRRLTAPEGRHTRPTTDRVKEALFGVIQFSVPGARVLDLFAGSGALGIEALSRGAAQAVFVENDRAALRALEANLAWTQGETRVFPADYRTALKKLAGQEFDIILIDPPYDAGYYGPAAEMIRKGGLLAKDGVLAVEVKTGTDSGCGEWFSLLKRKTYGAVSLEFYEG